MILTDRNSLDRNENFLDLLGYVSNIDYEKYREISEIFVDNRNDFRKRGLFLVDGSAIAFRKKADGESYSRKIALFVGSRNLGMKNMANYFESNEEVKTKVLGLDFVLLYDNKVDKPYIFSTNDANSLSDALLNEDVGNVDSVFLFRKSETGAFVSSGEVNDALEAVFYNNGTLKHNTINDKRVRKTGIVTNNLPVFNVWRKHEMRDYRSLIEDTFDSSVYDEQKKLFHQIKKAL